MARSGGGIGCVGIIGHVFFSLLFLVWLVVAVAIQLVTSLALAVWSAACFVAVSLLTASNALRRPLYWKWHHLKGETGVDQLRFPEGFLWGVSTAAHQIEGGNDNNQWSRWEDIERPAGQLRTVKGGDKSGKACEHWDRLGEDLGLIKGLGVGGYRFSIEWSKVEPRKGEFDQAAIDHYHEEIDGLLAAGIVPMVTLLHFTHPLWFEDRGGFERDDSPACFVAFARRMYQEYGGKVSLWCTINEPEVCTGNGYVIGVFPPGKLAALQKSGIVLGNLLKAHVEVYTALHRDAAAQGREGLQVGIVKDLFQFHAHKWYNVLDHFLAWIFDNLFNKVIIQFFKTGRYRWWVPFWSYVAFYDDRAPEANDFVGLNYYSHYYASVWNLIFEPEMEEKLRALPAETMTDMPHCIYPEGLYCALKTMSALGHPLYVTENGVADADDTRRRLYLKRYLYALSRAIKDGCDVRGYFYWSLYDNFEWCEGYGPRFGLYEVDFDTQRRTLRDSSKYFVEVVNKHSGDRSASSQSQQGSGSRTLGGGTRGHPSLPGDLPGNGKARLASSGKTTETPLGQYQTLPSGISEAVVPQTSGGGGSDGGSGADQGIGSGSTVDENRDFVRV